MALGVPLIACDCVPADAGFFAVNFQPGPMRTLTAEDLGLPSDPPDHKPGPPLYVQSVDIANGVITLGPDRPGRGKP